MDTSIEKRVIDPKFFEFKLVHVFIVLPFIIGWSGFFLAYGQWKEHQERDINGLNTATAQLAVQVDKLADKVARIDNSGSYFEAALVERTKGDIASSERRMVAAEKAMSELWPKVERIDTNLTWITQWIQAQEAAKARIK